MLELLTDPNAWISFATLVVLEIVLGIDNIVFIAIVSQHLPKKQQAAARRLGLSIAIVLRVLLLLTISWIISLRETLFTAFGIDFSWRDLILGAGGLFLLAKGTREIHTEVEGEERGQRGKAVASFAGVILQIAMLDIVFSLDSVITAVGMANHIAIMVAAVVVAMIVMLVAAAPVGRFVHNHPTVKMLCLSFLLLIGTALIAEGLHFHIPKGYIYFAIAFSAGVEALNLMARRKQMRKADTGERVV
jgi:predicted tellurium resistance membrane protein TerC